MNRHVHEFRHAEKKEREICETQLNIPSPPGSSFLKIPLSRAVIKSVKDITQQFIHNPVELTQNATIQCQHKPGLSTVLVCEIWLFVSGPGDSQSTLCMICNSTACLERLCTKGQTLNLDIHPENK